MKETLLSVDLGTTHCRVSLYDASGRSLACARAECPVVTDAAGRAEQDAEAVWRTVRELLRQAVGTAGRDEVSALSLSVQGDAIIAVDGQGAALHPAILGMDYRSQPQALEVDRRMGARRVFRRTGMRPHPINSLCKVLWLRANRPDVFGATRRILTYADFLLWKLGAEPTIDVTMASRTMALDLGQQTWSSWILNGLDIDAALFSRIAACGEPVGCMSRALATEIGLSSQPTLAAGAHDQVCAALGAGVPARGTSVISTGTAEVLSTVLDSPVVGNAMFDGFYPCYRFAEPGTYFTFSLNHAGGILLEWFRGLLSGPLGHEADYDQLIGAPPADPSPLLVLPHFNGSGTPWCDTGSRGAIVGLTLSSSAGEIAQAILESLAFELRINLERMQAAGVRFGEIGAVGGGARSAAWLQIKADVLGRPIRALSQSDTASIGAAILAGIGGGLFATLPEGIERMSPGSTTIDPRPAQSKRYEQRYQTYRELYPRLSPIHRRMAAP